MTFTAKEFRKETDTHARNHRPKIEKSMEKDLYKMVHRTPIASFPTDQNDARERDFEAPDITFSRTWKRLPATEREKSSNSTDDEYTNGTMHERKRGEQPTQRLNKRKHGQNQHSHEHHLISIDSSKI